MGLHKLKEDFEKSDFSEKRLFDVDRDNKE